MADIKTALYYLIALAAGFVAHEIAQARAASLFGDDTPRREGRASLHPMAHADPLGTYILPGLLLLLVVSGASVLPFAYGKPMPLEPNYMRKPRRDYILTLLAGPAANLLLAAVAALALRAVPSGEGAVFLDRFLLVNVILTVFNLMPIPPLDGSKILARYLPAKAAHVMDELQVYGGLFILAVFFLLPSPVFSIVEALGNGLCKVLVGSSCP